MKNMLISLSVCLFILPGCSSQESMSNLKLKADEALDKKDYHAAINYLEKAVSHEPRNQETHYLLGQCYKQLQCADGSKINIADPDMTKKASHHFKKVIEISPKYEGRTFVFGPYSKIQGLWGALGMSYLFKGQVDSAISALKTGQRQGGFTPALLEYNQNTLASCEKNAILFTNGDNDTYPAWFLQLVEGYRRDITVINLSLLNIPWYINQLKNDYPFGDNNIKINLTDDEINNLTYSPWTEKEVALIVKNDPMNPDGSIKWQIKPTIKNKALRVQDKMVLEILRANDWERPVYFATTVSKVNKLGLDDYLSFESLVFRLSSHKADLSIEKLDKNCLNVYTYAGVKDKQLEFMKEVQSLYRNYRASLIRLAHYYYEADKAGKAKSTLDFMNQMLPEQQIPYLNKKFKDDVDTFYQKVRQNQI